MALSSSRFNHCASSRALVILLAFCFSDLVAFHASFACFFRWLMALIGFFSLRFTSVLIANRSFSGYFSVPVQVAFLTQFFGRVPYIQAIYHRTAGAVPYLAGVCTVQLLDQTDGGDG